MIYRYIALGETTLSGFSMAERLSAGSIPTVEPTLKLGWMAATLDPEVLPIFCSNGLQLIIYHHFRA